MTALKEVLLSRNKRGPQASQVGCARPDPPAPARAGQSARGRHDQRLAAQSWLRRGRDRGPSVLGPGVVVEAGAKIADSVIFADTRVRTGATVTRSIVDSGCDLSDGARVGDDSVALDDPAGIAIIGRECQVGSPLKLGARLAPGTTT